MTQRRTGILSHLARDSRGNTTLMVGAALLPLMALIGGGLDMSVSYMARAKLQNACDSAVLAGRQSMEGTDWKNKNKQEAQKFFDFNFPGNAYGARNTKFDIDQNASDSQELIGTASASIPTSIMKIFGYDTIEIAVSCDAKREQGHNDVVLVLDTTGSMNDAPSAGGASKISRLRTGASGLYRALDDGSNSETRYGIVSYSHTVNIGRSLRNRDFLKEQEYINFWCNNGWCYYNTKQVHINNSSWNNVTGDDQGNLQAFRTSGDACIEERSTVGYGDSGIEIKDYIKDDDIDLLPANANDTKLQFGRYDPAIQEGESQSGCPSESSKLQKYADEASFNAAINAATARVTGGTYHDIGMLWGTRFISRTGFFASENPDDINGIPVRQHIVFMTDGKLDTGGRLYSAHGIEDFQARTQGTGTRSQKHIDRFASVCARAKSRDVTVWVIALDVTDIADIKPCATSDDHFYTSDGSDLEQVFERIGQGIGNLRLTR
ncbi:pilus assembly protein [Altererythrobacter lutimaris]|uniref:Pilus assembly protein n=1 Tax=Altererythrobacter lutimaris TaxID=2743979 RepID=A0A850H9C4_9SPHN|nr:TadE/TadG family type IV pilus assembly protein [Altererythrobacter lutimaris]NVE93541.1 pilus assembly protein [Altererythrobacter lutimaris]